MSSTIYKDAMRAKGAADAADFQKRSAEMDGTAMYAEEEKIPDFAEAVKVKNMLERPWGQDNGFICRSKVGHVVRLIQPYDSDIYTQEPEDAALAAHWRFVYSTDPLKAKPFLDSETHMSESYYRMDECCTWEGHVWRSNLATNVYSPTAYPAGWTDLGTIEDVMGGRIGGVA